MLPFFRQTSFSTLCIFLTLLIFSYVIIFCGFVSLAKVPTRGSMLSSSPAQGDPSAWRIPLTPLAHWKTHVNREQLGVESSSPARHSRASLSGAWDAETSRTPLKEIVLDLDDENLTDPRQMTDGSPSNSSKVRQAGEVSIGHETALTSDGSSKKPFVSQRSFLATRVLFPSSHGEGAAAERTEPGPDSEDEFGAPKFRQLFGSVLESLAHRRGQASLRSSARIVPPRRPLRYGWSTSQSPEASVEKSSSRTEARRLASASPIFTHSHQRCDTAKDVVVVQSQPETTTTARASVIAAPPRSILREVPSTPSDDEVLRVPHAALRSKSPSCVAKIEIEPDVVVEVVFTLKDDTARLAANFVEAYGLKTSVLSLIQSHLDKQQRKKNAEGLKKDTSPRPRPTSSLTSQCPQAFPSIPTEGKGTVVRPTRTTLLREARLNRQAAIPQKPSAGRPRPDRSLSAPSGPDFYQRLHAPPPRTRSASKSRSEFSSSNERELREHCTFRPRINRPYYAPVWRVPVHHHEEKAQPASVSLMSWREPSTRSSFKPITAERNPSIFEEDYVVHTAPSSSSRSQPKEISRLGANHSNGPRRAGSDTTGWSFLMGR